MNITKLPKLPPQALRGVLALLLAVPLMASASIVLTAQSVAVNAGTAGNFFDVTLSNTGPNAITLGGFSFEISVAGAGITLTSATTATAISYIFAGVSLFGPNINTSGPGSTLGASDLWDFSGATPTVGAGGTVGLGHVFFDVAAGTSGPFSVSFSPYGFTSLSDLLGSNLAADLVQLGTITVNDPGGAAIPEPSSLVLVAMPALYLMYRRRRSAVDESAA